jgi:hypothetical protein
MTYLSEFIVLGGIGYFFTRHGAEFLVRLEHFQFADSFAFVEVGFRGNLYD